MEKQSYWRSLQNQRISRRRLLVATSVGTAGLVTAAACGGGAGEPPARGTPAATGTPVAAEQPRRGGRYRAVVMGDWGTIDPLTSVGNATGILPRMYNVLLNRSNAKPDFWFFDLAESYEHPDDLTYVFNIRPGVKIGPNDLGIPERDMDALDAESRTQRIREDEDALGRVFTEQWMASAEAPDAKTYVVTTTGPYAYFVSRIGRALGGCIPPREFFEQGISLKDKGVGAGPFLLVPGTYQETGGVSFDRNPNYYRKDDATGAQLPYVDGIDVVRIAERQARRTAFLDRQIYSYGAETADEAKELVRLQPDLYIRRNPAFTFISFSMNPTREPWNDDRIRKAALYALDRQQFIDLVVGPGEGRPNGLVHWPTGPYAFNEEELEELQPHDPRRSRELIRAATGQDTIRIKVMYPVSEIEFHDKHLPIFLRQMREAGFEIEEDVKDFGTWLSDYTRVRYDASLSLNQIYETPEIPLNWQSSKGPQGDDNFAIGVGVLYPEIDEAILESQATTDPEEHVEKVRQVQRLIYDKGPSFLPIFSWYAYTLYWNFVKDMPQGLGDTAWFLNTWWLDL